MMNKENKITGRIAKNIEQQWSNLFQVHTLMHKEVFPNIYKLYNIKWSINFGNLKKSIFFQCNNVNNFI